ncbi:MAG: hypothetical protein E7A56_10160 [Cutibacterium avidum]|nr:hypothetical protein [Cutibacterium avidum]
MGVTKLSVVMWTIFGITLRLWMHVAVAGPLGTKSVSTQKAEIDKMQEYLRGCPR